MARRRMRARRAASTSSSALGRRSEMGMRTRSASKVPALLLALALAAMPADARQTAQGAPPAQPGAAQTAGTGAQVMLDRVAAIVNGDLVLESDVDAEQRF